MIAANARGLRAKQQRRQVDVAEAGGMSRSVLSFLESGRRRVTIEDLIALCQGLDCGIRDLLAGADPDDIARLQL